MQPIRIGILCDAGCKFAPWEMRLFERIANDTRFSIVALVVDARTQPPSRGRLAKIMDLTLWRRRFASLPLTAANDLDRRFAGRDKPADAPVFSALLPSLPRVTVTPERRRHVDLFSDADANAVRDQKLDLLLRHGFGIIKGPILTAATFGIWSFHHADNGVNRGGPPGFWEAARGEPVTGVTLQVLTPELDGGEVIARAWYSTRANAARNRSHIMEESVELIWRELGRLAEARAPRTEPSGLYDNPLFVAPRPAEALRYLGRRLGNVVAGLKHTHRVKRRMRPHMWTLAFGKGDIRNTALWRVREVDPPDNRYWADPFLIEKDGTHYVFYEDFDYAQNRAWISVGRLAGDQFEVIGTALDAGYHMSFPYVFAHEGEIYMLPETVAKDCVEVWRATSFPTRWERHATALHGRSAADTTLFRHGGAWWMLTNIATPAVGDHCSSLHVFRVDGPDLKSVEPHPHNPVVIDSRVARNAGRPFVADGKLYRPSQNNSHGVYGYGFNLMEVTALSLERYEERLAHKAEPNFKPGLVGTHHVDQCGDRFVIDICRAKGGRGKPESPLRA
jgi:hypothetical protein